LGDDEVKLTKRAYGWPEDAQFLVPDGVMDHFAAGIGARGAAARAAWNKLFADYKTKFPNAVLHNLYGPTEAAIDVTAYDCSQLDYPFVPIGAPIANTQIYILDQHNNVQAIGVPGELHIAGDGLARGYLNRPELTQEKFVANPFMPGSRMYKTGDLARWLDDGNIQYLGRIDTQVKIRGFRIELGEIEACLNQHPGIEDSVVIAQGEEGDAGGIEPVVGGELGVEHKMLRQAAILALPERDEAKHLLGLVALADVGVRIAEHLAGGVLGQKGEDAGLAAATLG
jgi:acyl-CoA synthetase (AMP-forming)/AMP-acid ligase II